MQGITRIKEKIMEEAEKEKARILSEAEKKAEEIFEKAKRKAEEIEHTLLEKAKKQAEEEKRKIISMAELEEKKRLLQAKQEIIDLVFKEAEDKIRQMEEERYKKLFFEMLIESAEGDEELIIAENDRSRITEDFLKKVNEELVKKGKKGNLKIVSFSKDITGGFILRSKNVEINGSFDYLVSIKREELETEIARILFEE
ncbi:V-type ATP synthase subunit E [Thermovenabulum sp.]|uniref:V-type ATP synthase subunit E n=1 Tax=Thermovenabulum sp. TaxID=3100335 RepID=UPI003C7CFE18